MSLKESWLAEKHDRQQELQQRQQAVQDMLLNYKQVRQEWSTHLRHNLTRFRAELSQQEHDRQSDFQVFQAKLQGFHDQLQADVRSLRANLHVDLYLLKVNTQTYLDECRAQRLHVKAETQRQLADFMENLQSEVQTYLAELEWLRHQRADQLQQDLQQSRATRKADVDALFTKLADFRQSLAQSVWGQSSSPVSRSSQSSTPAQQTAIPPSTPIVTRPASSFRIKAAPPKTTLPKKISTSNGKTAGVKPGVASKAVTPEIAPTTPPAITEVDFEKEVYSFLHDQQGARLTQIESALHLNRFQTVDALRSLIQKGLITQNDRVYSPTSLA